MIIQIHSNSPSICPSLTANLSSNSSRELLPSSVSFFLHWNGRVYVRVYVRARAHVCNCVSFLSCVCTCVGACACICVSVYVRVCVCVCV